MVLIGVSGCAWTVAGLLRDAVAMQALARDTIERVARDGVPPPGDPLWWPELAVSDEAVAGLQERIDRLGALETIGEPACRASVSAATSGAGGREAVCITRVTHAGGAIDTRLVWRRDGEAWRLAGYFIRPAEGAAAR